MNFKIDKLFWLSFILYFDPGGIQAGYFQGVIIPGVIAFNDFFALVMLGSFILLPKMDKFPVINPSLRNLLIFIILWVIYFILFFGIIIPQSNTSLFNFFRQTRDSYFYYILIYPVYVFTLRSFDLFFKYLIFSSMILLPLFLISVFFNIKIIPFWTGNRVFIDAVRYFMYSYGNMAILPNLAMVVLIFRFKVPYRKYIIAAGALMALVWLISITRRQIIGMFLVYLIYYFLYQFLKKKFWLSTNLIRIGSYLILYLLFVYLLNTDAFTNSVKAVENTYKSMSIPQTGNLLAEDSRLTLNKVLFKDLIKNHFYWGTGYSKNWYSGEGMSDEGAYEVSDYPLLASFAAFGLIGLIIFIYFYYWLIKFLRSLLFILKNNHKNINFQSHESLFIITFIGFIFLKLLQYMNWFNVMGLGNAAETYFYIAIAYGCIIRLLKLSTNKGIRNEESCDYSIYRY